MTLGQRYAQLLETVKIREHPLFRSRKTFHELELQARWFAGDFGNRFVTTTGDDLEIIQFGTWNREAGPDFRDAAIRLNGGKAMRGSIELDITDRSWETHGHATNDAFEDTILHVITESGSREFFTRTKSNRHVPQVRIDPATLPLSSVGIVPLARPGRCHAPLRNLPEEKIRSILDAAAQFRLRRKATRLQRMIEHHGRDEAIFQELAAALGYKENKLPFTLIAQRLPLQSLKKEGEQAEALLFGVAGFLEAPDLAHFDKTTRTYLRDLWDRWWRHRDQLQRLVLPAKTWRFGGARPLNHPQRRLGALAAIVHVWPRLANSLGKFAVADVEKFFLGLRHPYWNFHYTLTSDPSEKEMALVGKTRIAEILANVVFPMRFAADESAWMAYEKLPAQLSNRSVETAALRLFGDDPRRAQLTKSVAHQQGLLQIYEDFCLQDDSDCAQCPFPEQMQKWT